MKAITLYVQESLQELHKVRWPTRQQAIRLSIIVIAFTAAFSLFLGAVDYVLSQVITFLISF